ncbi:hypothetical protein EGR_11193 [Echinococcus granulosus]|uniref:Uncharacterized protein n=1 Tax=Echinococcus granulosus TaxID=6210 RepID=W6TYW2_ECHGR|nr:hypothetical protein EGR_11193 [Echinococcus granulosus]EUB53950.1 hypothetical protein EGR_11193 [Echinococcus granulosus]
MHRFAEICRRNFYTLFRAANSRFDINDTFIEHNQ